MRIILASTSPRRKMLMDLLDIDYEIIPSCFDEKLENNNSIENQSKRLAYMKAKDVFDRTSGNRIVIGADTMVLKNNKLYGKPKNILDAKEMLKELKNTSNNIITSIAVLISDNGKTIEYVDMDKTTVYLSDVTDEEMNKWFESGEALDKAGAYSVSPYEKFAMFVNKVEGNFNAAIGLPIDKIYKHISKYL